MFQLFLQCFTKKYAKFSGRASRREFWSFQLFYAIYQTIILIILAPSHPIYNVHDLYMFLTLWLLFSLPFILPALTVTVRRLHDLNTTGWLILINLVPYINFISGLVMLIAFCFRGTVGDNKYGADPIDQNELLNTEQN